MKPKRSKRRRKWDGPYAMVARMLGAGWEEPYRLLEALRAAERINKERAACVYYCAELYGHLE